MAFLKKTLLILYILQIFNLHHAQNCPVYIDDSSCQCSRSKSNETLIKCDALLQPEKYQLSQIFELAGTRIQIKLLEIKNKHLPVLQDYILNTNGIDIISLSLINDEIVEISEKAFANLSLLNTLNLCCNKLTNLNDQIFNQPFGNTLNYLDLSQNGIDSIESSLFSNLSQLAYLDLSYNQLTKIEPSSFPSKLTTIHLDHNYLTSLDQYLFNNLLQTITLQNNKLLDIGPYSFLNNRITTLDLSYQNLKLISLNAISHCDMLTKIDLRYNQLTRLSRGFLHDLKSMDSLVLANNLIDTLVYDNFGNLENLNLLLLSNNYISSIADGAFVNLHGLSKLSLSNNIIRELNMNTFSNLVALKTLQIDHNKLSTILANTFIGLINLDMLTLTANYITTIKSDSFRSLTNLTILVLSENKLTSVEASTFRGLLKLVQLDLSSNQIETIEANAFNSLASLQDINLGYNLIKALDNKMFNGILALKALNVENNRLTFINNGTFMNMSSLTKLALDMNQLRWIDNLTFIGLETALEELDLSNNNLIEAKTGALSGLVSLNVLYLYKIGLNPLQLVNLKGCKRLLDLDLSFNQIEIDNSTFISSNLRNVFLRKVGLNNLEFLQLNQMTNLVELDLSDNEWDWSVFGEHSLMFKRDIPIEYLYLSNTSLNTIDYLGINSLSSLFLLDLSINRIEFIRNGTFSWPGRKSTIYSLYLQNNLIKKIEANSFFYVQNLGSLDLSINMLASQSDLDNVKLAFFTYLTYLDMSNSNLSSFPVFNRVTTGYRLKYLALASNQIESLSSGNFEQLQNLVSLDLANNCIRSIDATTNGLFVYLSKLEALNLSSNFIDDASLGKMQFDALISLNMLNLSCNSIRTVSRFLFSGLKKLEQIDLSYNYLVSIETNSFYMLSVLTSVYLMDNGADGEGMRPNISENFIYSCGLIKFVYVSSLDIVTANLASFTSSLKAVEANKVVNGAVYYNSINIIVDNFDYYKKRTREACELTIYLLRYKIHLNLFSDFDFDVFVAFCYSLDLIAES